MRFIRIWAALVAVIGAGALSSSVLATPPSGLTTTTVAEAPLPPIRINSRYRPDPASQPPANWHAELRTHGVSDLYVVDNKLAPGGTTGWHTHPGPSLIVVVSGTVTNYRGDDGRCPGVDYPVGTSFVDAGGDDVHMLKNNGTSTAETVAVQFIPHGAARKIDAPPPRNCPS